MYTCVCGTLPAAEAEVLPAAEHPGQEEQSWAHAGDEQPPGRAGVSAPSQLSSFPHAALGHSLKGGPGQPERSRPQSRWERRGLSTPGRSTGNAAACQKGTRAVEGVGGEWD